MFTGSLRRNRRFRLVPSRRHRAVVLTTGLIALVLPAGAAWAMWSATGTGGGGGKAVTAVALTVSAGTPTADLFPGHGGAVVFSVTNPNPYPVTITSASGVSVTSATGGIGGTCASTDFQLAAGTISNGTVAANATSDVTLSGALSMKTTAPDACQGVTVAVAATLNGTQS